MARSTAPLFNTGSVPGSARSTALACELGDAPKFVDAPEKIFDAVVSCACVSNPMTTSQFIGARGKEQGARSCETPGRSQMPIRRLLVGVGHAQHQRLAPVVADELQSHGPSPRAET